MSASSSSSGAQVHPAPAPTPELAQTAATPQVGQRSSDEHTVEGLQGPSATQEMQHEAAMLLLMPTPVHPALSLCASFGELQGVPAVPRSPPNWPPPVLPACPVRIMHSHGSRTRFNDLYPSVDAARAIRPKAPGDFHGVLLFYVPLTADGSVAQIPWDSSHADCNNPCWPRVLLATRLDLRVATVGGKAEPGETPVQAAYRELWEETGVKLDPLTHPPCAQFSGVEPGRHSAHHFVTVTHDRAQFDAWCRSVAPPTPAGSFVENVGLVNVPLFWSYGVRYGKRTEYGLPQQAPHFIALPEVSYALYVLGLMDWERLMKLNGMSSSSRLLLTEGQSSAAAAAAGAGRAHIVSQGVSNSHSARSGSGSSGAYQPSRAPRGAPHAHAYAQQPQSQSRESEPIRSWRAAAPIASSGNREGTRDRGQ